MGIWPENFEAWNWARWEDLVSFSCQSVSQNHILRKYQFSNTFNSYELKSLVCGDTLSTSRMLECCILDGHQTSQCIDIVTAVKNKYVFDDSMNFEVQISRRTDVVMTFKNKFVFEESSTNHTTHL